MDRQKFFEQRTARVRETMQAKKVDGLILTNLEEEHGGNIRYLTGFSGSSSICCLTLERGVLITDSRYDIQAREEVKDPWEVRILAPGKKYLDLDIVKEEVSSERIGIIGSQVTADMLFTLRRKLRPTKIVRLPDIMAKVQEIKDELDLVYIRKAVRGIEEALQYVYTLVRPGVSELEIDRALAMALPLGAVTAFSSIIASGSRSAMPHGTASKKLIERGDIVQFDVGCKIDGYNSDISRVVVVGKATCEHKRMYRALQEAIRESLKLYCPGVPVKQAHNKANEVLRAHGYPDIPHSLGHGLGLRVHEMPGVSPYASKRKVFRAGQVVTNEPGIYIEGWGGMRIERDVLITERGPEILDDTLTTDLLEL